MPQSGFDKMDARKIHSALFQYMYGKRVDKLAAVFKRHGYSIHDDNAQRTQGLVLPQSLYEEDNFDPVAEVLNALGEADRRVASAKSGRRQLDSGRHLGRLSAHSSAASRAPERRRPGSGSRCGTVASPPWSSDRRCPG